MKIATLETIPVSVPYRHREVSSQVARDGVSDVLVKLDDRRRVSSGGAKRAAVPTPRRSKLRSAR